MDPATLRAIERLRTCTSDMNAACDEGALVVREVERFLNDDLSVGVTASVVVCTETDAEYPCDTLLTYERIGARYRIAVGEEGPGEYQSKPWSDCDRETKLQSLSKLPQLLAEISNSVQTTLEEAQAASAAAMELLSALRRSGDA